MRRQGMAEPTGSGARGAAAAPPVPPGHLGRDITIVLLAKTAALVLLYVACFAPDHRPAVTAGHLADALLGAPAAASPAPPPPLREPVRRD
jgi:hypothetical protein